MAVFAIGDIQGCYDELRLLLNKINFNSDRDRLWFTGDLVNRGPKSLETLRFIHALAENAFVVLGNHDLHLLATAYDHERPGKKDTLDDILKAPDREQLLNWLRHQPLIHVDNDIGMVMLHAGLHPDWDIKTAISLSREVEKTLQGEQHIEFYKHMYGDKPAAWSDNLKGWPRLRYITNVFTRLRYCDNQGNISLNYKGAPGTQAEGLHPWFEIEHRASRNENIIFGHWSTLILAEGIQFKNLYPLDTGCLWGGKLTALRIETKPYKKFQIDCPETRKSSTAIA
jgi:bis(5'-nucleosyl)-tetraphosphatase (symmetrical)